MFGGAVQKMETGSDFGRSHLIAALGTSHGTEAPLFKRSRSREQDSEIDGLIDVLGTRAPSAALQTIESAVGSEIGPITDTFQGDRSILPAQDVQGRSLGDDPARFQQEQPRAERDRLGGTVSHVEHRDRQGSLDVA
jgi:hypothetical protein